MDKIVYGLLKLLSRLPLPVLYIISYFLYFLNVYIIRYRTQVVMENLQKAFPNKSKAELVKIQRKFFTNFFDFLVEMLKNFTVPADELKRRIQFLNRDLFQKAFKEKKNVIMLAGHVFNWEWFNVLHTLLPQNHSHPVYLRMKNKFWEEKICEVRNRFGSESIETKDVLKHLLKNRKDGDAIYLFLADQSPHSRKITHGTTFLNQQTPVFTGYDRVGDKRDFSFIYCDTKKVKRGYYQVNFVEITPDAEVFEEYEVVEKFHRLLEKSIEKDPSNWLWTHRRWKYQNVLQNLKNTDQPS